MLETDHLGDWSPEKGCCWLRTFRQHVWKPSSESEDRWLSHMLSKRQSPTTVLLRTTVTQMIVFNQTYHHDTEPSTWIFLASVKCLNSRYSNVLFLDFYELNHHLTIWSSDVHFTPTLIICFIFVVSNE